jgi:hypothetical protein
MLSSAFYSPSPEYPVRHSSLADYAAAQLAGSKLPIAKAGSALIPRPAASGLRGASFFHTQWSNERNCGFDGLVFVFIQVHPDHLFVVLQREPVGNHIV